MVVWSGWVEVVGSHKSVEVSVNAGLKVWEIVTQVIKAGIRVNPQKNGKNVS